MPTFSYKAVNESGARVSGTIDAESRQNAIGTLVARGLIPSKISTRTSVSEGLGLNRLMDHVRPISAPDLILFTKQFRTLIRAGVPMLKLLQVLETQTENPRLQKIISQLSQNISEGASLYDGFRRHPRVFSSLFCSMVRAGEASGALADILDRLIYIMEHEHQIKSEIRTALQYPIFVCIFLISAFFFLLTFVVPKFSAYYVKAGVELPLPTRICIFMYQLLTSYWPILLVLSISGIIALVYYLRTDQGQFFKDTLLMKIPLVGPLFQKAAMSRFSSIFAILQSSGVTILESMRILSGTIDNKAVGRDFDQINERLEEGRGIAGPLRNSRYFTPLVINMIAVGEESGHLEEVLNEIAQHYDAEVTYATRKLSESIVPILTVLLAVVVGFFALAIYLPIVDLIKLRTNMGL